MPKNPSIVSGKRRYSKYYNSSLYNNSSDSSEESNLSYSSSYSYNNSSNSSSNSSSSSSSYSSSHSNSSDEELIDADGISDDSVGSSEYLSGFTSNGSDGNHNNILNARIAASRGGKYNSVFGKGPYRAKSLPSKSIQRLYPKKKHHHHHHHHHRYHQHKDKKYDNEINDKKEKLLEDNINEPKSSNTNNESNQISLNYTNEESSEMSLRQRYSAVKKTFSRKSRKNVQPYRSKRIGKTTARGKYILPSNYRRDSISSSSSTSDSDSNNSTNSDSDLESNNNINETNNNNLNNLYPFNVNKSNSPLNEEAKINSNSHTKRLYCICKQHIENENNIVKCEFCSGIYR